MDSQPNANDQTFPVISEHIVATAGICGGKPRIAGHRITVQNIVIWHEQGGLTPDEIVAQHPGLTLADVHAALSYYWDHADEVRSRIEAEQNFVDELRAKSPSLLQQKLTQRNADDSIPS
jgi:uncharacterized protein (DUF433 family)